MEEKKKILKNWKLWVGVIIVILICVTISIFILRNKLTPEETVSRFMYLVENKNYEEAKQLCNGDLEKLEILSKINPSNFTFEFSENKKNAETIILEDEETAEVTKMYIELDSTVLGWKIKEYNVITDFIAQEVVQERLEKNEKVSDSQFLCWAISDKTKIEDISKYAEDNLIILTLFADFMKDGKYEKAMQLYKPINSDLGNAKELNEEEIKKFNWEDYSIYNSTGFYGIDTYMIDDGYEKINVMISTDHTIAHIYKFI